jgi:TetR/AcrR family transcriptional repressor of nem operon
MRVSREQSVENRVKILQVAARLFREKGFDGVGIAELMKKAGLTHGGFYGHFSSKDELMAESCERAVDELLISHQARTEDDDRFTPYQLFIAHYLSCEHRDNPGSGCLMAALGAEAARQSPLVKRAFTQGANRLLNAAMKIMPAKKVRRKNGKTQC